MNRSANLSATAGLSADLLTVGWAEFDALHHPHLLRPEFMFALWSLEDAIDNGRPLDAALVPVIQYVGSVSA